MKQLHYLPLKKCCAAFWRHLDICHSELWWHGHMISLRENCKEGKGHKETLGAETESCSAPWPSTPGAFHSSHQISCIGTYRGKCLHTSAVSVEAVFSCMATSEKKQKQTWETCNIQYALMQPVLCLGTKHKAKQLALTKTEVEKASLCVCTGDQAVSQYTHFALILQGFTVPAPSQMEQDCVFPTQRGAGANAFLSFFLISLWQKGSLKAGRKKTESISLWKELELLWYSVSSTWPFYYF